jgi:hypothetical protein
MATNAAQTTMPSRNTASGSSGRTVLAIRWGFPTSRGTLSLLSDERVLLGRDDDCQVKLPGNETSRRHAEIRREDPLHILKDLDSRNGVFLNGAQIREAPISAGQVLRLGEWIGIVVSASPDVPEPEPVFDLLAKSTVPPWLVVILQAIHNLPNFDQIPPRPPLSFALETAFSRACSGQTRHCA